jgi:hypothetical protein
MPPLVRAPARAPACGPAPASCASPGNHAQHGTQCVPAASAYPPPHRRAPMKGAPSSPPPAGKKKLVFKLRSVNSMVRPAANTPVRRCCGPDVGPGRRRSAKFPARAPRPCGAYMWGVGRMDPRPTAVATRPHENTAPTGLSITSPSPATSWWRVRVRAGPAEMMSSPGPRERWAPEPRPGAPIPDAKTTASAPPPRPSCSRPRAPQSRRPRWLQLPTSQA